MKKNINYAKLDNGSLVLSPNCLFIGDKQIFNATAEQYAEQGYLPVVRMEMPESGEGYYYSPIYTERDNTIIQEWKKVEYEITDGVEV